MPAETATAAAAADVVRHGVETYDAARDEEQRQQPDAARVVADAEHARAFVPRRPLPELEALGRRAEGRQEYQSRAGHGPLHLPERADEPRRRGAVLQIDAPGRLPREEHPEVDDGAGDRERRGGELSTVGARRHMCSLPTFTPALALRAAPGVLSFLQSQSRSDSQTSEARVGR